MHSDEIAILMAAGMGQRMRPLTEKMPKPLIKVHGRPMAETLISALQERGVGHTYVVVGYLADSFSYLTEKFGNITIVNNPYYESINNISSIYAVKDVMRGHNCFICEADLYVPDPAVLKSAHDKSCYYGKLIQGHSDDWVFDRDSQGRIVRIGKGGDNCYNMCGISFFLKEDSTVIADAVANAWGKEGYEGLFWDEVVDTVLDRVNLVVHPVGADEIIEIDTVEELEKV